MGRKNFLAIPGAADERGHWRTCSFFAGSPRTVPPSTLKDELETGRRYKHRAECGRPRSRVDEVFGIAICLHEDGGLRFGRRIIGNRWEEGRALGRAWRVEAEKLLPSERHTHPLMNQGAYSYA